MACDHFQDEGSRHSGHVTPVNDRGLMNDLMVTSVDGSQKQSNSKPVNENPNGPFSNVKDSALDSPKQTYAYELLESSRSATEKDFPLPLTMHSAHKKSIDSAYRGDSPKARPCKDETQFGRNFKGKTGLFDKTGDCHDIYDICPQSFQPAIKLKAPLHVKNREIRNQKKRSIEQGNILILRPGMILLRSYISFTDQVVHFFLLTF